MSRLRLQNGDDHPDAAGKHLEDASALEAAGRADGAAYLAGYVAECALKALILLETGASPNAPPPWKKGREGHDLGELHRQAVILASVAGARTARYWGPAVQGLAVARLAAWDPEMHYRAPSMTGAEATSWLGEARLIYDETVGKMRLDGVL
jgi:hypothetical protein